MESGGRHFERIGESLLVSYSIGDEFAPEFTEAYDIATGGLAMLTNAELPAGSKLLVTLELKGDPEPELRLHATVRWSHPDPVIERYRTGLAFVDVDGALRARLQRYVDTLHLLRTMEIS